MVTKYSELNKEQQNAVDVMLSGKNVYLTGSAGTGKSATLNVFVAEARRQKRNVVVCAPTGIAALNVGGSTIHRVFAAELVPYTGKDRSFLKATDVVAVADTIVIDEISMCRIDLFQYVGAIINGENSRRGGASQGKKPIQLIVMGDFFQLSPILKDDEKEIVEAFYGENMKYAFQASAWKSFNFVELALNEVVRQDSMQFIEHLNDVRLGICNDLGWFKRNTRCEPIKGAVTLCPTNKRVAEINERNLAELAGSPTTYAAMISGLVKPSEYPTEKELVLKPGARVIMLNNDKGGRWANGTVATVLETTPNLVVSTPKCKRAAVERHDWEYKKYAVEEDTGELKMEVIGTFSQYPLRLAYAITIHKSQGLTFDEANIDPDVFLPGMLYVALSRVRTPHGIYLMSDIKPQKVKADESVLRFHMRAA